MKKILFLFIVGSGMTFTMGCSKDEINTSNKVEEAPMTMISSAVNAKGEQVEEVVNVTIPMNTQYQRDLGVFGREEYAEVIKPPVHAAASELNRVENSHIVYTYMPAKEFTGVDEVTIQLNKDSDGTGPQSISFLRIIITVETPK